MMSKGRRNVFCILMMLFVIKSISDWCSFVSKHLADRNLRAKLNAERNKDPLCLIANNPFETLLQDGPCYNKTMGYAHNPWLRHDAWRTIEKKAEDKRKYEEAAAIEKEAIEAKQFGTKTKSLKGVKPKIKGRKANFNKTGKETETHDYFVKFLTFLVFLTSIWDVITEKFKDWFKGGDRNGNKDKNQEKNKTSLVDYTLNKHLRRESQQEANGDQLMRQDVADNRAKVTQTLIHQSSLDRAFPIVTSKGGVNSEKLRRNSVPSSFVNSEKPSLSVFGTPTRFSKRVSVDINVEDITDIRKKPRHFIRRH